MIGSFYTVDQIAELLLIHPKTIQRYIREGKLHATKIGKRWRVSGHDLSRFTEDAPGLEGEKPPAAAPRERVKASAVVDIAVRGQTEATRLIHGLNAALCAKPPEYGQSSMVAQYLEPEDTVRLSLWGNAAFLAALLDTVQAYLSAEDGER
ncbi:MAG: helix-turn-helix domain-containing protein [Clostridiales bacterium]|nr:helix-turn-helix domain-containing protein [Clostridiales bacterium]